MAEIRVTSRNRTKEFVEIRKQKHYGERTSFSKARNEIELEEARKPIMLPVGSPPQWVAHVDSLNQLFDKISNKMEMLRHSHQQLLLPQVEDDVGEEQRVEILTQEITQLFQEARGKVKELESEDGQKKLGKNLRASMAQRLRDLSVIFRKYQKDFLHKLQQRQQKRREYKLDISENKEEDDENFHVEMSFSQAQKHTLSIAEETVIQREREIMQIAKSIKELAQIFNDLATLVYEQGTIIDRIDYNLEVVEENVTTAVEELKKANVSHKKYTGKLCLLVLCLVILMGVIVVVKAIFFPK